MKEMYCARCKNCTDGPATTGEECVKIKDCPCHEEKVSGGIDEAMKSVDSQVGRAVERLGEEVDK